MGAWGRYPVFFLTCAGSKHYADPRMNSLEAALIFAKSSKLQARLPPLDPTTAAMLTSSNIPPVSAQMAALEPCKEGHIHIQALEICPPDRV